MYAIVYRRSNKRVRVNGELTPVLHYPEQAKKYIERNLDNSNYITIKEVGK